MPEIFLIRHGETDFNLRNIVQGGGIDSDLNETGRAQGAAFHRHYKDVPFDRIYCTELKRTRQTLAGWTADGHAIETLPELNEFGWGVLEGIEGDDIVKAAFEKTLGAWRAGDLHARVEGGESPLEAWDRAAKGIARVLRETPAGGRALVCAHGRIMRVVLAQISGYGLHNMDLFPHQNTALNLIRRTADDRFRIIKLNDISHLQ